MIERQKDLLVQESQYKYSFQNSCFNAVQYVHFSHRLDKLNKQRVAMATTTISVYTSFHATEQMNDETPSKSTFKPSLFGDPHSRGGGVATPSP